MHRFFPLTLVLAGTLGLPAATGAGEPKVSVTVVVILASADGKAKTDPELADIAKELKKLDKNLKSFRLGTCTCRSVAVGSKDTFPLVDDQVAVVCVHKGIEDDRVELKVKPPMVGEVTYAVCCGKYFPIITGYHTKDKNERLIVAVMASPCSKSK